MEPTAKAISEPTNRVSRGAILAALLAILGLVPAAAWAGDNVWTSIGPAGSAVSYLLADPKDSGTVYAFTQSGGAVKSTNGGANWTSIGFVPLAIDPQNPSTLYAAASQSLAKSVNGGANWGVIGSLNPIWITDLVIDPLNTSTLYAITMAFDTCGAETFHKSLDGGVNWMSFEFLSLGVGASCVLDLAIDPQNPSILYAAFEHGGAYKTTNSGASWAAVNSGLPAGGNNPSAVSLSIDPLNPSTLYAVSGTFSQFFFILTVFKSNDAGNSWYAANSGLPSWSSNSDCCYRPRLIVDPQRPNRIFLAAAMNGVQRVFLSTNGGAAWADSGFAMPSGSYWSYLDVGPLGTVYTSTRHESIG